MILEVEVFLLFICIAIGWSCNELFIVICACRWSCKWLLNIVVLTDVGGVSRSGHFVVWRCKLVLLDSLVGTWLL